eukprot:352022-Chlamydomonas_euryale.AAC.1
MGSGAKGRRTRNEASCGVVEIGCGVVDIGCGVVEIGCGVVEIGCGVVDIANNTQPLNRPGPQPWRPKTPEDTGVREAAEQRVLGVEGV